MERGENMKREKRWSQGEGDRREGEIAKKGGKYGDRMGGERLEKEDERGRRMERRDRGGREGKR